MNEKRVDKIYNKLKEKTDKELLEMWNGSMTEEGFEALKLIIKEREHGKENKINETSDRTYETEYQKSNWLVKCLYWLVDKAGLSSGIAIVGLGAWCFIWSIVHDNFNQIELSTILIALGVLIMELKKALGVLIMELKKCSIRYTPEKADPKET